MKALLAKYKQLVSAGYGRQQIAEMLAKENNLTETDQKFILETIFKKPKYESTKNIKDRL